MYVYAGVDGVTEVTEAYYLVAGLSQCAQLQLIVID
jgi:hypothetical protein